MSADACISLYVPVDQLPRLVNKLVELIDKSGRPSQAVCEVQFADVTCVLPVCRFVEEKSLEVKVDGELSSLEVNLPVRVKEVDDYLTSDELQELMADDGKTVWLQYSVYLQLGQQYAGLSLAGTTSVEDTLLMDDSSQLRKKLHSLWKQCNGVLATISAYGASILLDDKFEERDEIDFATPDGAEPAVDRYIQAALAWRK